MKKEKKKFSGNLNPFLVLMVMVVICTIVSYFVVPGAYDRETVDGVVVQDVLHPSRRDDCEALAVRDVIVRGQGMLHAMARPQRAAVAEGEYAVAGKGAVQHHLGAGGVILRIIDALAAVHHEALERCLHHAVVKDRGLLAEILLHDVVDGVRAAGSRLLLRHREGVDEADFR